jgi:uncharacterized membrane protein YraQ (UPF0718 family)
LDPALLASLAALIVGPLVFERARRPWALAGIDAFALVAVGGLVAAHIVPQCFALAGWKAAPVLALGLFGPGLLCGTRLLSGKSGSRVTLPLALLGIALHALFDGVALAGGVDKALALAVILHRISDGLGIWWLARPAYGKRVAALLLGTLAVFSVIGFWLEAPISAGTSHSWFALLQALIAGSLLHVILRHPPSVPRVGALPRGTALASGIGGLLGVAVVLSLEAFVPVESRGQGGSLFLEMALQSAPALLGAYVAVAFLHAWDLDLKKLLGRGSALKQAVRGTLVGLPMPICSCGVIPLYRSLVLQGVPATAALSFLVSGPEFSVTAIFLSVSLLGGEITLVRTLAAGTLAVLVGLVVGRRAPAPEGVFAPTPQAERAPLAERFVASLRYGLGDMVDATAPWILVGLGLAALLAPFLSAEKMLGVSPALEVPLFALIGMPLYVCASGSTPLAAVLIMKGVSPGATIAFLLTGPATNLTTFGLLSRLHSRSTALLFALTAGLTATALGWAANAFLGAAGAQLPEHEHVHGGSLLELSSALALLVLFVVSVLRQGTRRFVGQVTSPHGVDAHDGHDHDHDGHGHDEPELAHAHAHGCCGEPAHG